MNKISVTYKGKSYLLETNRKTVESLERQGFVMNELSDRPMTLIPMFYRSFFKTHHPTLKNEEIDKIWKSLKNKDAVLEKLLEMYSEVISVVFTDDEDEAEGNAVWEMVD